MKRTLGLITVYLLQITLLVLFLVPELRINVANNFPFLTNLWNGYKSFLSWFGELFSLDKIPNVSARLINMLSAFIFNILFTVIYSLIVRVVVKLIDHSRRKKLAKNSLSVYSLSEEEKAKFNYKLYEKKVSIKGVFSFLIPTIIILFILLIRFDKSICEEFSNREGFFDIYSNSLRPFFLSIHKNSLYVIEAITASYIDFIEGIIEIIKIEIIEYVFLGFFIILIYVLWSVIVVFFVKINRKRAAQKRARRAREKYISKMERIELSSKNNTDERISSKAKEIIGEDLINQVLEDDASSISIVGEKYVGSDIVTIRKQADYIDDISTGVTDLGVQGTGEEDSEPIERKIPIFVGDEDVEITLDREPYVDVEEEENFEDYEEDIMPFFEKYSPELMDYSYINESLLETQIEVIDEDKKLEEEFVSVNEFEDKKDIIINKEQVDISKQDTINEEKCEQIDEAPLFEAKEEVKIVFKETKKKNIKPIDIRKRTSEERFKNAKKKYLVYPLNQGKVTPSQKKRNLIRRKYKK